MSRLISLGALGGAMLAGIGACSTPPSATDLHTAGPPKVQQVMMTEEQTDSSGAPHSRADALAYGHHDDPYFVNDDGKVVAAKADFTDQQFRVVMDHLLVGNNLEFIQCRTPVSNSNPPGAANFSTVPMGATPDDLANCSGPEDLVLVRCRGDHAVCINNTGKPQVTDDDGVLVMPGDPVGIEDKNQDGVPDRDLFIEGAVRIICKNQAGTKIEAPLDTTKSYWQPSGNQQVPAHGGVDALGPALVLFLSKGLPTNTTCSIVFDPSVVDDKGDEVCAPVGGDPDVDCTPGDTSQIQFGVTGLRLTSNVPNNGLQVTTSKKIMLKFNDTMDEASLAANVTVTENGVQEPVTVVAEKDSSTKLPNLTYDIIPNSETTLTANSTYVVTIGPDVKDFGGQPMGGAFCPSTAPNCSFTFTTGAN